MKTFIIIIAMLISTSAYAQNQNQQNKSPTSNPRTLSITVPCDNFQSVFEVMIENKESLLWTANSYIRATVTGQNHPGSLYVWSNLDRQTVSITIVFSDGMMCLLAPGNTFVPYSGNQPWDKPPKPSAKKYNP